MAAVPASKLMTDLANEFSTKIDWDIKPAPGSEESLSLSAARTKPEMTAKIDGELVVEFKGVEGTVTETFYRVMGQASAATTLRELLRRVETEVHHSGMVAPTTIVLVAEALKLTEDWVRPAERMRRKMC